MNWRRYIFLKLTTNVALTNIVPAARIVAGGSLEGAPPARPFLVMRFQDESPDLNDGGRPVAGRRILQLWAYDEPGSYDRIDTILKAARDAVVGSVATVIGADSFSNGTEVVWQTDSSELSDDQLKAITRNSSYQLVGVQ